MWNRRSVLEMPPLPNNALLFRYSHMLETGLLRPYLVDASSRYLVSLGSELCKYSSSSVQRSATRTRGSSRGAKYESTRRALHSCSADTASPCAAGVSSARSIALTQIKTSYILYWCFSFLRAKTSGRI